MKLFKNLFLLFSDKIDSDNESTSVAFVLNVKTSKNTIILKKGLAPNTLKEGDTIYDVANNMLGKYCAIL